MALVRRLGQPSRGHGRIYFYAARNCCTFVGADTFVACTRSSLPEIDIGETCTWVCVRETSILLLSRIYEKNGRSLALSHLVSMYHCSAASVLRLQGQRSMFYSFVLSGTSFNTERDLIFKITFSTLSNFGKLCSLLRINLPDCKIHTSCDISIRTSTRGLIAKDFTREFKIL